MRPVASNEREKWALPDTEHLYRRQSASQELAALLRPWPAPSQLVSPAVNPVLNALSQARHNLQSLSQSQPKSPPDFETARNLDCGSDLNSPSRIHTTGAGREATLPTTVRSRSFPMMLSAHVQLLYWKAF
jgi:hypothetical protein